MIAELAGTIDSSLLVPHSPWKEHAYLCDLMSHVVTQCSVSSPPPFPPFLPPFLPPPHIGEYSFKVELQKHSAHEPLVTLLHSTDPDVQVGGGKEVGRII